MATFFTQNRRLIILAARPDNIIIGKTLVRMTCPR
jgi:hypothetical protein